MNNTRRNGHNTSESSPAYSYSETGGDSSGESLGRQQAENQNVYVQVPRLVTEHKLIELDDYILKDVVTERLIEIPEITEEVVIKEIRVPQYVEVPLPEIVTVEQFYDVTRNVPQPFYSETDVTIAVPSLQPSYASDCIIDLPVYAPHFIEVPIPEELILNDETFLETTTSLMNVLSALQSSANMSMKDMEKFAELAKTLAIEKLFTGLTDAAYLTKITDQLLNNIHPATRATLIAE